MTPLLTILFVLICIAVEAMLHGSENSAKAKLKIRDNLPKA